MNIGELNSIGLNSSGGNNTGYNDLIASIAVNTNPALATFKDLATSISVASSVTPGDLQASIVVSTYKWMTSELVNAQQQPALRPYFKGKILDDTIVPESILTPPGVPINGEIVTAPDGTLLAVGADGTGRLCFWHITDPTSASQWASPTVLQNVYLNNFNATIAVSQYILGTYSIDIYAAEDNAGNIRIKNYHSDDGGATFSSAITTNAPGIATATTDNFYLTAVQPVLNADNSISRMFMYIVNNGNWYDVVYQFYTGSGGSFSTAVTWPTSVDPQDLIIHSLDAYLTPDGVYHIVISAFHQWEDTTTNENFGLYQTEITRMTNGVADVWTPLAPIFVNTSSASINMNSFTLPKITYDGSFYRILFRAVIVDAVQGSLVYTTTNVGTKIYSFMTQSVDFENFTYPFMLMMTNGTYFSDTYANSFNKFGTSQYIVGGSGTLWRYTLNNIAADVTDSIVKYEFDESAGAASVLTLTIGNMNNQWVGASPTKTGAAAIAKNMKIMIDQGYYLSDGSVQTVPRDVFFIDDIKLNVTANKNELVITARNSYKNLKTFVTKYAYNFKGVRYYSDAFDGSTLSDWNQVSGSWQEINNTIQPATTPTTTAMITHQIEDPNNSEEAFYSFYVNLPAANVDGRVLTVYPYYQDDNNCLRIRFTTVGGGIQLTIFSFQNGGSRTIQAGTFLPAELTDSETIPILIHRYNYINYTAIIGSNSYNTVKSLDPNTGPPNTLPYIFNNFGSAEMSVVVSGTWKPRNGVFAISCNNYQANISLFKHCEYGKSQSIQDLVQKIGSLSTIYTYNPQYNFQDTQFALSDYDYDNAPTHNPGYLSIPASSNLVNKTFNFTNNEIEFRARIRPGDPNSQYGLNFFFRTNTKSIGFAAGYIWNVQNTPQPGSFVTSRIRFRDSVAGGDFLFNSSSPVDFYPATTSNGYNFDLTQWHTYRLVSVDGWMFGFIDDRLVIAWLDNHVSFAPAYAALSSGGIGFNTLSNSTLDIQYIRSRLLWNQVQNFSLSPGDDADNSLKNLLDTVQAWSFSNLMAQFTNVILDPAQVSSYTYQNGIVSHTVDDSDKEYVNQITVYGFNVSAVQQDQSSIATTGRVREKTIVDYKITTYQDVLLRAQKELTNVNRFNNQNTPMYPMNVGAEIFDVAHIINTGDNSTDVDASYRVYNQNLSNPGSNGFYSIELETGTL